jgi:hypothetical protein
VISRHSTSLPPPSQFFGIYHDVSYHYSSSNTPHTPDNTKYGLPVVEIGSDGVIGFHFEPRCVLTIFCLMMLTSGLSGLISVPRSALRRPLLDAASARSGKWRFTEINLVINHSLAFEGWTPMRRTKSAMQTPAKLSGSSSPMASSSASLSPCTLDRVPETFKLPDELVDIVVLVNGRVLPMLACQGTPCPHERIYCEWCYFRPSKVCSNADHLPSQPSDVDAKTQSPPPSTCEVPCQRQD